MTIPAQAIEHLIDKIKHLPPDRFSEVEDFVDFLQMRRRHDQPIVAQQQLSDFPVDNLGKWPEDFSLRREELYGNDER